MIKIEIKLPRKLKKKVKKVARNYANFGSVSKANYDGFILFSYEYKMN